MLNFHLLCHTKVNFNMSLGHFSLLNLRVGCYKSHGLSSLCIETSLCKEKKNVNVCREIAFAILTGWSSPSPSLQQ